MRRDRVSGQTRRRKPHHDDASHRSGQCDKKRINDIGPGSRGPHLRCRHAPPHPALIERMLYCLVDIFCRGFRPKSVRALTGHQADRTSRTFAD